MKTKLAIIPARYASSRFEGKPLAIIGKKPMIMWVYDAVINSCLFDKVLIATDDDRIYNKVKELKANVIMTSNSLTNGTQRCNQVVSFLEKENEKYDIVINIQGDEPLIKKEMLQKIIEGFENNNADIVTLKKSITNEEDVFDSNVVKVVCSNDNKALYFSRNPIPFARDENISNLINKNVYFKHIGIYGYKTNVLKEITSLKESILEQTEKLEQLRWLENGYNIIVQQTDFDTIGVDTPQDLEKVKQIINKSL